MPFPSVPRLGIDSSVNRVMPRNEHFLPRNNGNYSESIPRIFSEQNSVANPMINQLVSKTISLATDVTVNSYWRKLLANPAQISAAARKQSTLYVHSLATFEFSDQIFGQWPTLRKNPKPLPTPFSQLLHTFPWLWDIHLCVLPGVRYVNTITFI